MAVILDICQNLFTNQKILYNVADLCREDFVIFMVQFASIIMDSFTVIPVIKNIWENIFCCKFVRKSLWVVTA